MSVYFEKVNQWPEGEICPIMRDELGSEGQPVYAHPAGRKGLLDYFWDRRELMHFHNEEGLKEWLKVSSKCPVCKGQASFKLSPVEKAQALFQTGASFGKGVYSFGKELMSWSYSSIKSHPIITSCALTYLSGSLNLAPSVGMGLLTTAGYLSAKGMSTDEIAKLPFLASWQLLNRLDNERYSFDLQGAALFGNLPLLRYFLTSGAEVDKVNFPNIIRNSPKNERLEIVKELIKHGIPIADSALRTAVLEGDSEVFQLLHQHRDQNTPLPKHLLANAARTTSLEMVQLLLKNGFDQPEMIELALIPALKNWDIFQLLCTYEPDFSNVPGLLRDAGLLARDRIPELLEIDALRKQAATAAGSRALHSYILPSKSLKALIEAGADVNYVYREFGDRTPLHVFAEAGQAKQCRILLENGAIPNPVNSRGETPADIAARSPDSPSKVEIVKMIKEFEEKSA